MAERLDKLGLSRLWRAIQLKIVSLVDSYVGPELDDIDTRLNNAVPTDHSSTTSDYGLGTTSKYGHVKLLSGVLSYDVTDPGVAAHPNMVKQVREYIQEETVKQARAGSLGLWGTAPNIDSFSTIESSGLYVIAGDENLVSIPKIPTVPTGVTLTGKNICIVENILRSESFAILGGDLITQKLTVITTDVSSDVDTDISSSTNVTDVHTYIRVGDTSGNITNWKEIMPAATGILF